MKDLVVLVPDKNAQHAIDALLKRTSALGIRHDVSHDSFVHPERDPGCLRHSHDFLRPLRKKYARALVLFDRWGCGMDNENVSAIQSIVEQNLSSNGWEPEVSGVVVFDPELEAWVFNDSPHVDRALGWAGREPTLRAWLRDRGLMETGAKPTDPKRAVEEALKFVNKPRSSAIYADLASKAGVSTCSDSSFAKFCRLLREWFKP